MNASKRKKQSQQIMKSEPSNLTALSAITVENTQYFERIALRQCNNYPVNNFLFSYFYIMQN